MIERLTITLPADMATALKAAVASGDYATTSEVVREALRDWKHKKALQTQAFEELRSDIDEGIADMEAGRVVDFDLDEIMALGRQRLAEIKSASK